MNQSTELETQLRMWGLRRPSAEIKERLFAAPGRTCAPLAERAKPTNDAQTPSWRLSWLAPATAGLVAMCCLFTQRNNPAISAPADAGPMVAMILSNHSAAAYLPGSFQATHNRLTAD